MLFKQEKVAYSVANAASTPEPTQVIEIDDVKYKYCPICYGTGLLPHPVEYMHVAFCYVCNGTGLLELINQKEMCGCANSKTVPIRS